MTGAMPPFRRVFDDALRASIPAAIFSGLPSTMHSLALERDPLEATTAAGAMILPNERRTPLLVVAALPVHLGLSFAWSFLLALVLPRRRPLLEGAVAGLGIAVLDLKILGRHFPRIRNLDPLPQFADHVAFGIIVAAKLASRADHPSR